MKIIGIAGKAGSGKDTAFELIQNHYEKLDKNVVQLSFASKIKEMCKILFNWDIDKLSNDFQYKEEYDSNDIACSIFNMTRREMMQKIGSEAMRDGIDKNFWIKCLKIEMSKYDNNTIGIITDCRFINEFEFIKNNNGKLIKVIRVDVETLTSYSEHQSEKDVELYQEWDYVVYNNVDKNKTISENKNNLMFQLNGVFND